MPSRRAQAHQERRQELAEATAKAVLNEWRKVDPEQVARSWARLLPRVTAMVQAGQLTAAQQTPEYLRSLLSDDDTPDVAPERFASQAPDGRRVDSLLARAIPRALRSRSLGESVRAAMARGASLLDMAVRTVVSDTGRQADQAAMVGTKGITSYVRVLELPSCARCIILAGKEYGVSTGFQRHPMCDCGMEPVTRRHRPVVQSPEDVYDAMTPEQRRKIFGEAGAKAIADGARISSVVNARKGMDTIEMHGRKVLATRTGTGSRKNPRPPRLMPEEIYRLADGDRDQAIRLLYKNGFLR